MDLIILFILFITQFHFTIPSFFVSLHSKRQLTNQLINQLTNKPI